MEHHEMPGILTVKRLRKRGKGSDTQNKLGELKKKKKDKLKQASKQKTMGPNPLKTADKWIKLLKRHQREKDYRQRTNHDLSI